MREILGLVPKHKHYIEVFGRPNALLFAKGAVLVDTINDHDGSIADFFACQRDMEAKREFLWYASRTIYSRAIAAAHAKDYSPDDPLPIRCWKWWTMAAPVFRGVYERPRPNGDSMLSAPRPIPFLEDFVKLLLRVQIEDRPHIVCVQRYATEEGLVFTAPTKRDRSSLDAELIAAMIAAPGAGIAVVPKSVGRTLAQSGWHRAIARLRPSRDEVWINPRCLEQLRAARRRTAHAVESLNTAPPPTREEQLTLLQDHEF